MRQTLMVLLLLLSTSVTNSVAEEQEIIVQLETEESLVPVHLKPIVSAATAFSRDYIAQLQTVLHFDLNHNGHSYTHPSTEGAYHVIKVTISDHKLMAEVSSPRLNHFKSVDNIPLTGSLAEDRHQMHKLSDALHRAMFGTDGIATTKILYTVRTPVSNPKEKQWNSDVWQVDYDGGNAHPVTQNQGYCITPCYVPAKSGFASGSFLYVAYKTGQPRIFLASLHEGVGNRLTALRGNQFMPTISRQRDKIAFISDVTGNPDLFMQRFSPEEGAIGKPQQIFSAGRATQGSPTFSPDGKRIAFVSNKDGSPRIYVMNIPAPRAHLKDLKASLLTRRNRENTAPSWSPDGTKLAYCSITNGVRQIWVYDFKNGEERQLTQGPHHKENPSWAPNSLHLTYNTTGDKESELYIVNLKQPESVKISSGRGEKRFPNWEPRVR